MLANRKRRNLDTVWQSGEEVFRWWMGENVNQITFDDLLGV